MGSGRLRRSEEIVGVRLAHVTRTAAPVFFDDLQVRVVHILRHLFEQLLAAALLDVLSRVEGLKQCLVLGIPVDALAVFLRKLVRVGCTGRGLHLVEEVDVRVVRMGIVGSRTRSRLLNCVGSACHQIYLRCATSL